MGIKMLHIKASAGWSPPCVRQAVSLTRMREGAILTPLEHHADE
jgi:hypothetical protein